MKVIALEEFVRTGSFGGLRVGESVKDDILELMGDAHETGDFGNIKAFKFGWYEFHFCKISGRIILIQNDHLAYDCTNHGEMIGFENQFVKIDTWFVEPFRPVKFPEVISHLEAAGIGYEIKRQAIAEKVSTYVEAHSGVTLDFLEETREGDPIIDQADFVLNAFRHWST